MALKSTGERRSRAAWPTQPGAEKTRGEKGARGRARLSLPTGVCLCTVTLAVDFGVESGPGACRQGRAEGVRMDGSVCPAGSQRRSPMGWRGASGSPIRPRAFVASWPGSPGGLSRLNSRRPGQPRPYLSQAGPAA